MRLSNLLNPRNLPFQVLAAGLLAVMLAAPVSAEPADHATTPETQTTESPSRLAGPQNESDADSASAKPDADANADSDAEIETVTSDPQADPETAESGTSDTETADTDPVDTEPSSQVLVDVDKSTQQMTVFVDGVELYSWPVSTGMRGYSTPSGTYTASSMNKIWYSKQWDNAPMPHAIFFTKKGHAIHASNETKKLGSPASHGCVRLAPKNAATLFKLVEEKGLKNTQVVLTGVSPGGESNVASQRQRQPQYPVYPGRRGYDGQYGYYDEAPPVRRKRKRFFQPYYDSPPVQQQQRGQRRWFRPPGY
jgi:lipoprotein-anchoring transpeptidase ErfK/SrfK